MTDRMMVINLSALWRIILWFIPRFSRETFAVSIGDNGKIDVECHILDVPENTRYDGVVLLDTFIWFDMAIVIPQRQKVYAWPDD